MAGLVPEKEHSDGSSNSSSQESGPEQRFLRNAPPALLGIGVIKAYQGESYEVHEDEQNGHRNRSFPLVF